MMIVPVKVCINDTIDTLKGFDSRRQIVTVQQSVRDRCVLDFISYPLLEWAKSIVSLTFRLKGAWVTVICFVRKNS